VVCLDIIFGNRCFDVGIYYRIGTYTNKLTTLMITHNMHDAIAYGNRLIMMHEGNVVVDVSGEEKKKLTIEQLLSLFEASSGSKFGSDKAILSR